MPIDDPTLLTAVNLLRRIIREERDKLDLDVWSRTVHFLTANDWLTKAPQFVATESEVQHVR